MIGLTQLKGRHPSFRRKPESRGRQPVMFYPVRRSWIPAFAGMTGSRISSCVTPVMSRFTLTALAVLVLALLLGAFIACGGDSRDDREERSSSSGSGGQSASDVPSDPEGLIPVDADQAFIFDVSAMLSGDIPGNIEDDFATWADELFDGDIDLGDVDTLVVIDDSLLLAQGSFNFDRIRDTLEELGYESEEFLGFETWGERAALIEDEDYVMLGFVPGALQEMLESIDRERNLLAYERNSDLSQVVDEVGSGAILYLLPDCGGFPLYGCVAFGASYSFRGSQSGTARVRAIYLHEDVESAEDTLSLVEQEDSLLDDSDIVEVTGVRTDGAAVIMEFVVEGSSLSDFDELVEEGPVARRLGPSSTSRSAPAAPAATVVGRPVSTSSLFPSSSPVLAVASTARPAATSSPRATLDLLALPVVAVGPFGRQHTGRRAHQPGPGCQRQNRQRRFPLLRVRCPAGPDLHHRDLCRVRLVPGASG